jgi:hypothetical protein
MLNPIPYQDAVEVIPPDEGDDIEQTVQVLRKLLRVHAEREQRYRRDVHVKAHGCARGEFRIPSLPPELAQGLFTHPRSFSAVVRFSNAAPWPMPDFLPDGRGLAIQVEDAPGDESSRLTPAVSTQDFLLANHPVFIARNVKDYLRLQELRLSSGDRPVGIGLRLLGRIWNPLNWRCRETLAAARVASRPPAHPASYHYYSMTPFRFGRYVAKYRVVPRNPAESSLLWNAPALLTRWDGMQYLLARSLSRGDLHFDFQVQLRRSERMPVEDATVEWSESESPYQTVATLIFPRQDISGAGPAGECERRSFNVWHCLLEHRPLGGINRSRRAAYAASAEARGATPAGRSSA